MNIILRLLKDYWPAILILLTFLAMDVRIGMLKDDLRDTEAALAKERFVTSALTEQINRQNEGIDALKEAADRNREAYLAGLTAAEKRAVRLQIKAEDILATKPPEDPELHCEAANTLLKEVTE